MEATKSISGSIEKDAGEPATHIKKGDKSASAWLVALAQNNSEELFKDQFGAPHALVGGEPVPLDSGAQAWLRKLLWNNSGKTAKREDLSAATETLAMLASFGEERTLHIRAAQHAGEVYIWAGPHNVIKVDQDGWRRVTDAPVLFRRVPTLKPLPDPKPGGDLTRFNRFIRLRHTKDQRLNIAWIVTAYLANIPRPINLGTGVQGSAKSTGQRVMKRALDPAMPEDLKLRRKDFAQNLDNCFVPLFDNAGPIDEDQSDDMCRATTGSGNADRKLYTDNQSIVRQYKRAMLVNGINNPTERGDFMDRALPVEYERIPKSERRAESDLWAEFNAEHPELLGAVLDALSGAIRLRVPLSETPRLADWAEYAAAVYEYMNERGHAGWGRDQFAKDWNAVEEKQHEAALEGSPVAQAIRRFMEDHTSHADTAAKLHEELTTVADGMGLNPDRNKLWPKTSNMLWKRIKEASPTLETYGIRAEQVSVGRGKDKRRVISLRGVSSGASLNVELTDQKADTYAVGSGGVSGASSEGKPSPSIPRTRREDIEEGDGREGTETFAQNADPADPAGPNAYLSHKTGVSSTNQANPAGPTIDDPWLWEEKLDPQTGKVVARIFHADVAIPKPALPDPSYVEPQPRGDEVDRIIVIDPESAIGLPAGGSRSYRAARNHIREFRRDWKGYALPADAEGWRDLLINGEGEFFTLDAVEQALEAA